MNEDGTEARHVTNALDLHSNIAWLPDGEHLVFGGAIETELDHYRKGVCIVRVDGTDLRFLVEVGRDEEVDMVAVSQ